MEDKNAMIPVVKTAIALSGGIISFATRAKASGVVQRAELAMLKDMTAKALREARAHHQSDLVYTNIEEIAKIQEHIDSLHRQGRLHGVSLNMATDHLIDLNNTLRRNLRDLESKDYR
jgi:predicted HTH domain antitoxin